MTRNLLVAIVGASLVIGLVIGVVWFFRDDDRDASRGNEATATPGTDAPPSADAQAIDLDALADTAADVPTATDFQVDLGEGQAGIRGIVRLSDPVAGAQVTLYRNQLPREIIDEGGTSVWALLGSGARGGPPFRGWAGGGRDLNRSFDAITRVTTNDAGEFLFSGLAAGDYLVAARTATSLVSPSGLIEYVEDETRTVDLPLIPGETLSGYVLDAQRNPLADAKIVARGVLVPPEVGFNGLFVSLDEVVLYLLNPLERAAVSTGDGSFVIATLPELEYELRVSAPPWADAEKLVTLPEPGPVEIVLVEGAAVTGRIENEKGEPIAGATVRLDPRRNPGFGSFRRIFQREADREASTDATGTFRFIGLPEGSYRLAAEHPGYQQGNLDGVVARTSEATDPVVLALSPGRIIEGIVTVAGGGPLAGIEIIPRPTGRDRGRGARRFRGALTRKVTDAEGRFRFDNLREGEYRLEFQSDDWAAHREEVGADQTWVEVALQPSEPLRGRLLNAEGKPVVGARVWATGAFDRGGRGGRGGFRGRPRRDESDAEGRFAIRGLAEGNYNLSVRARGYLTLQIPSGSDRDLGDVVLDTAPFVTGWVLDPEGTPLPGSRVQATPARLEEENEDRGRRGRERRGRMRWRGASVVSDTEGRFRLEFTEPGDVWDVRATFSMLMPSAVERVDARGATRELTLQLDWGAVISGLVKSFDGTPVVGAQVNVRQLSASDGERGGRRRGGARSFARSRADGFFQVSGLEEGVYALSVQAAGYARGSVPDLELARGEQRSLTIALEPERILRGTVVRATDLAPLLGARVRVSSPERGGGWATTQADGVFEVGQLGSAEYRVRVDLRGYESARLEGIRADDAALMVTLVPTLELSGWVQDVATGEPIAGARLRAEPVDGERRRRRSARSSDDGSFRIEELSRGDWKISVQAPGYIEVIENVVLPLPPSTPELTFALAAGGRIRGIVVDFAGRGIADAQIRAHATTATAGETTGGVARPGGGRPQGRTISREDGSFEVEGLPEGTFRLAIDHPEYLPFEVEVLDVTIGGVPAEVRARLEPGAEVSGEVFLADGSRATEGIVLVIGDAPQFRRQVPIEDGRYRIAGLPEGSFRVSYRPSRRGPSEGEIPFEVRARERKDLDLRLGG